MEKVIKIDGKDIRFKVTAGTMYRYKSQFGREYLADIIELQELQSTQNEDSQNKIKKINFELFYNIAWVFAKTADNNIPPPQEWLDSFDTFPITTIFGELSDLIKQNGAIDRKNG